MKSLESKRTWSEIPLCVLGVLCFITSVMSQTRFTISQKSPPDNIFNQNDEGKWFVWNSNKPDLFGFFLKAVVVATTPFHSFASTCLLLFGINKKNLYLFLPWLLLTFKGFLIIQTFNLLELLRLLLEKRISLAMEGEWKMLSLALVIIVFDAAEYICFNEVFRMFKILWTNSSQSCEEAETEEEKSITEEVQMEDYSDDKDRNEQQSST